MANQGDNHYNANIDALQALLKVLHDVKPLPPPIIESLEREVAALRKRGCDRVADLLQSVIDSQS